MYYVIGSHSTMDTERTHCNKERAVGRVGANERKKTTLSASIDKFRPELVTGMPTRRGEQGSKLKRINLPLPSDKQQFSSIFTEPQLERTETEGTVRCNSGVIHSEIYDFPHPGRFQHHPQDKPREDRGVVYPPDFDDIPSSQPTVISTLHIIESEVVEMVTSDEVQRNLFYEVLWFNLPVCFVVDPWRCSDCCFNYPSY